MTTYAKRRCCDETARVKLMVVDEAWRYLQDPAVLSYLAEAAKTWRKKNAALIVATQSAVDVTGTAGAEALLESMPTKLFLANPDLPDKAAETFRLNPSEMNTIRGLIPKRELYLRRPDAAGILRLEVDPASYWLYTSSPVDAARRAAAVEEHGLEELVCESGRIYSFLVTEGSAGEPHLIVRVEHPEIEDPRISPGVNTPAFVRRSQVTAYQEMAETAMQTVATVQEEAEVRVAEAKALAEGETEAFRSDYPTRLNFPYRLEDKAIKWPFLVEGMWNDGQFTYLRAGAQETPALYEEKDGKPALVAYDLEEDGLYIARHILGNGWLQIGKEKAKWRFTAPKVAP